jgi:hypothetical protein
VTLPSPERPEPSPQNPFKNPLLYSSVVLGFVLLVVVWVMLSRWLENRRIEQRALNEKSQSQRENDARAVEALGGKELSIQSFYAAPGAVRRGEAVQLCYDVANATSVKLEPQSAPVWPSHARCVSVSPAKTTTYTLTIADAAGNAKTASLEVRVR